MGQDETYSKVKRENNVHSFVKLVFRYCPSNEVDHVGLQWLDELFWVPDHSLPVQWIDLEVWDCLGALPLG